MLIVHIICAIASLAVAGLAALSPSRLKLAASYSLAAATLASGTYLVICDSSHIVSSCLSGLIYLSLISLMIARSRQVLANNLKEK